MPVSNEENYKSLSSNIIKDLNKQRDMPGSWIRRFINTKSKSQQGFGELTS